MGLVADKLVFNHGFEQRASITKDRDQGPRSSLENRLRCTSMSQVSSICCTSTLSPLSSTSKPSTLNPQPKALVCIPPSHPPCVCEACACGIASVTNRYIRVALRMRVCMRVCIGTHVRICARVCMYGICTGGTCVLCVLTCARARACIQREYCCSLCARVVVQKM